MDLFLNLLGVSWTCANRVANQLIIIVPLLVQFWWAEIQQSRTQPYVSRETSFGILETARLERETDSPRGDWLMKAMLGPVGTLRTTWSWVVVAD